jgi:hypothetical protein
MKLSNAEAAILLLTQQIVNEDGLDPDEAAEHALCALPNPRPEFADWLRGRDAAD